MANDEQKLISPKVTFATGGSAIGYTTGKALSTLLLYYVFDQGVPGEVKLAIEFICEGGLSVIGAFVSGYFKAEPQ